MSEPKQPLRAGTTLTMAHIEAALDRLFSGAGGPDEYFVIHDGKTYVTRNGIEFVEIYPEAI